jgi:hypothetical protein
MYAARWADRRRRVDAGAMASHRGRDWRVSARPTLVEWGSARRPCPLVVSCGQTARITAALRLSVLHQLTSHIRSARLTARGSVYRRHREIHWDLWLCGPAIQGDCASGGQGHAVNLALTRDLSPPGCDMRATKSGRRAKAGAAREAISGDPTPARSSCSIAPTIAPKFTPRTLRTAVHTDAHEIFVSNGPRDHIRAPAPKR